MTEHTWEVTLHGNYPGFDTYAVVERANNRTHRIIARALTAEEAHAIAHCRETTAALGDLWEAVHREDGDDFDADRVREELQRAFDVLMLAKGVKT